MSLLLLCGYIAMLAFAVVHRLYSPAGLFIASLLWQLAQHLLVL